MSLFNLSSYVCGNHIYNDVWLALVGALLQCEQEAMNAVAVKNNGPTIGPCSTHHIQHLFSILLWGGSIVYMITGTQECSSNLYVQWSCRHNSAVSSGIRPLPLIGVLLNNFLFISDCLNASMLYGWRQVLGKSVYSLKVLSDHLWKCQHSMQVKCLFNSHLSPTCISESVRSKANRSVMSKSSRCWYLAHNKMSHSLDLRACKGFMIKSKFSRMDHWWNICPTKSCTYMYGVMISHI